MTDEHPDTDAEDHPEMDASQTKHDERRHDWPVRESVTEYETGWYAGGYDRVEQPDGSGKRYYWAELPPAAVIVAVQDESVIFVEQYRPTIREHCLELPAGIVEDGESYEEAAARELREETGFDPAETTLLGSFWVATGVLRHERGIVFATGLDQADRELDENEFLSVTRYPVDGVLKRAREPPANDATIEALLLAKADGYLDW
jgi:ADP-ribose pyrophosphatase